MVQLESSRDGVFSAGASLDIRETKMCIAILCMCYVQIWCRNRASVVVSHISWLGDSGFMGMQLPFEA